VGESAVPKVGESVVVVGERGNLFFSATVTRVTPSKGRPFSLVTPKACLDQLYCCSLGLSATS
jgi:hypothetical protein